MQQSQPNGTALPPGTLATQRSRNNEQTVNHYQQQQNRPPRHQSLDLVRFNNSNTMMPQQQNNYNFSGSGGSLMQQPPMNMDMLMNSFNPYPDLVNFQANNKNNNGGDGSGGHQSRRNANNRFVFLRINLKFKAKWFKRFKIDMLCFLVEVSFTITRTKKSRQCFMKFFLTRSKLI